jgi:hypothetical protein
MNQTIDHLIDIIADIKCSVGKLDPTSLATLERKTLGGRIFKQCSEFVGTVAEILSAQPEVYADIPVNGNDLGDEQTEAEYWLTLRDCLRELAEQANDTYLSKQAGTIQKAMNVVAQVHNETLLPFGPGPDGSVRQQLMLPALLLLIKRNKTRQKVRTARRGQRLRAAGKPVPKKRKKPMTKDKKALVAKQVDQAMGRAPRR